LADRIAGLVDFTTTSTTERLRRKLGPISTPCPPRTRS